MFDHRRPAGEVVRYNELVDVVEGYIATGHHVAVEAVLYGDQLAVIPVPGVDIGVDRPANELGEISFICIVFENHPHLLGNIEVVEEDESIAKDAGDLHKLDEPPQLNGAK